MKRWCSIGLMVMVLSLLMLASFSNVVAMDAAEDGQKETIPSEKIGGLALPADSGDYHSGDVAVINNIIEKNGLEATKNDPANWDFVSWTVNETPRRIEVLDLDDTSLHGELDLRGLTMLAYLSCGRNQLTGLNVDGLTVLEELYCDENELVTLDVSSLTCLGKLDCKKNQLVSLSFGKPTPLKEINCSQNRLGTLDLSGVTALRVLDCSKNLLSTLDLSQVVDLQKLNCAYNQLAQVDVNHLKQLEALDCGSNQLRTLEVNSLKELFTLGCDNNLLETLDVSGCEDLEVIHCWTNQLTSLEVKDCPNLESLSCWENNITSLDVSGLELRTLATGANPLETLNIRGCSSLEILSFEDFGKGGYPELQLTQLDLSGLTSLTDVDLEEMPLEIFTTIEGKKLALNNPLVMKLVGYDPVSHELTLKAETGHDIFENWHFAGQVHFAKNTNEGSNPVVFTLDGDAIIDADLTRVVRGITLSQEALSLKIGSEKTLSAIITPVDATNQEIVWHSSDAAIASVSAEGKVTAHAVGTAVVTATAADGSGVYANCTVTVTAPAPRTSDPTQVSLLVAGACLSGALALLAAKKRREEMLKERR